MRPGEISHRESVVGEKVFEMLERIVHRFAVRAVREPPLGAPALC